MRPEIKHQSSVVGLNSTVFTTDNMVRLFSLKKLLTVADTIVPSTHLTEGGQLVMHKTHTYTMCTCMHVKNEFHFLPSNRLISALVCMLADLQVVVVAVGVHLVSGVYVEH